MALYEQTPVASAATLAPTDLLGSPNYVEQTASGSQTIDDSLNHMSTKDHATISNVLSARDSNVADASMADRIEPPSGDKVTDSAPIDTTDVANQQPKGKRISFEGPIRTPCPDYSSRKLTHIFRFH